MAQDFRQFDEQGFPLPPRFEDLKYHDDEAFRRPKFSLRLKRLVLLVVVISVVVPAIFGPQILSAGREMLARWLTGRAERKYLEGDFHGALADMNRAIDWSPKTWQLYVQRAEVREKLNDLDGSLADLNRAIEGNAEAWQLYLRRAQVRHALDDVDGSLADLNRAIERNRRAWELYLLRAEWREQAHDLHGSLSDWNELVRLAKIRDHLPEPPHRRFMNPDRSALLAELHAHRSWVLVRLERHREAIDDATQAVKLQRTPSHLNARAYARALAKIELREGLADIEQALQGTQRASPEFLDTRGYLLHLLDRNAEALKDLNRALQLAEQSKREIASRQAAADPREMQQMLKAADHNLAVMHHHRGLVYEKLGRKPEAEEDLRRGDWLGYDPENGVF